MHRRLDGYTDIRLDVDGNVNIPGNRPRAGAHARVRVYAAAEPEPLWRTLWRQARKALKPKHRAVLDALLLSATQVNR